MKGCTWVPHTQSGSCSPAQHPSLQPNQKEPGLWGQRWWGREEGDRNEAGLLRSVQDVAQGVHFLSSTS